MGTLINLAVSINLDYHYWGSTLIYRPLSYSLRCLYQLPLVNNQKPALLRIRQLSVDIEMKIVRLKHVLLAEGLG